MGPRSEKVEDGVTRSEFWPLALVSTESGAVGDSLSFFSSSTFSDLISAGVLVGLLRSRPAAGMTGGGGWW